MDRMEMLCRAWIECDPNRGGNKPGSGFHPDDPITHGSDDMVGKPLWEWFRPRAEALDAYVKRHGYEIVRPATEGTRD